jgi:hypothetical protein
MISELEIEKWINDNCCPVKYVDTPVFTYTYIKDNKILTKCCQVGTCVLTGLDSLERLIPYKNGLKHLFIFRNESGKIVTTIPRETGFLSTIRLCIVAGNNRYKFNKNKNQDGRIRN